MPSVPVDPSRLEEHNTLQRSYFSSTPKPRMAPHRTPYVDRQVDAMIRFARLQPGQRILDVGCGMGRYTLPLVERGLQVEGLDLTPALLAELERQNKTGSRIPLHCGDLLDLAEPLAGQFDALVGFFPLHHLHNLDLCYGAMARMLKPGGVIAFLEPNAYCPFYYLQVAFASHMRWEGEKGIAQMRRGPIFHAMSAAGLIDLQFERFGFAPPAIANRTWGRSVERGLEALPFLSPIRAFQLFGGRAATR